MSRGRRVRTSSLVAGVAAAVLLVGCGGGSEAQDVPDPSDDTLAEPAHVVTLRLDVDSSDPETVEQVAEVVRRRVEALGTGRAEVGWTGSTIEVLVADGDEELLRAALASTGRFELRPVLAMALGSSTSTPADDGAAEPGDTLEVEDPDASAGPSVLSLGPVVVTGEQIESATASAQPDGAWGVELVLTEAGIGAFNAMATQCFETAPTCPEQQGAGRGQMAILVDGDLVVAPTVNQSTFERDQIVISGDFDEAEARAVAAALTGGAAPAAWTLQG